MVMVEQGILKYLQICIFSITSDMCDVRKTDHVRSNRTSCLNFVLIDYLHDQTITHAPTRIHTEDKRNLSILLLINFTRRTLRTDENFFKRAP